MTHELYKLANGGFKLKSPKLDKVKFFVNIEAAAETLESFGVFPEEIDYALIQLTIHEHNYANFSQKNGLFVFSDNVEVPEQVL